MEALTASRLADLAGVTRAEVDRLVDLGVLVAREGEAPFRASDLHKVRLARACDRSRPGPCWPPCRWSARSPRPACRRPTSGWPPGRWWSKGGDYYGRTVNLAARIAARAGAGQILVSEPVAQEAAGGITFVELGELVLEGISAPVRVLEALSRRPA
jgi:Adenylate and Guanylate cyclase catalytic domain